MDRSAVVPSSRVRTTERFRFSPAVRIGDLVVCSGQVGHTAAPDGTPLEIEQQMVSVWERVVEVLHAAGTDADHIVEIVSFHVDLHRHLDTFVMVKDRFVTGPVLPAWTAVGVSDLAPPGCVVEIKVTAIRPSPASTPSARTSNPTKE